nr:Ankyrin and Glutaminase domain containing protein [Haemonchus contortus]
MPRPPVLQSITLYRLPTRFHYFQESSQRENLTAMIDLQQQADFNHKDNGGMSMPLLGQSPPNEAHSQHNLNAIGEILNRKTSVAQIMSKTVEGLNHAYELRDSSPEDLIFDLFKMPNKEEASISKLIKVLKSFGLRESDPRLRHMMDRMKSFEDEDDDARNFLLSRDKFKECIHPSMQLISQALRNHLIIPSWGEFCGQVKAIFEECSHIKDGNVATYIPQLARQNPDIWGLSICSIDGQRVSFGDSKVPFCVQSVSKAFNYAIVSSDLGADFVHSYVGHEPSGRLFNEICLDANGKPHNPLINAGAIIVTSLIRNHLTMADRFDFVLNEYRKLAGGEHVGFNNATFLSERDTADRNYALSYYMKENKCFPPGTQGLREELDLYFQLCSLETNCDTAAVMAATLANGGVCPLTDELCIHPRPCRDVLSLMYSCGMYDFSGKFAFQVGLPAKSGVSGVMIVVVPNLMGIALFSPPLDKLGNSTRGVAFCQKLIEAFNFHNYDSLLHADSKKHDPRRRIGNRDTEIVVSLLFAAKYGDFDVVRRMYLQGINLEMADYDGRTALHVAAAEGHMHLVKFFVNVAKVNHQPRDRWGRTPLDDARAFHHEDCVRFLLKHHARGHKISIPTDVPASENGAEMNSQADESSGEDELTSSTGMMLINDDDMKEKACNGNRRVLPSIKLQRLSEADENGA